MRYSRLWSYLGIFFCMLAILQACSVNAAKGLQREGIFSVDPLRSSLIGTNMWSGLEPGRTFPKLLVKDYDGKKVDLSTMDRKMLICYEHIATGGNVKIGFYEKVALDWAEELQVVVLYGATPAKELAAQLKAAGVIVIPNFGYAEKLLAQAHVPIVYLVDQNKVIQCRYKFTTSNWKGLYQSLEVFARTGTVPEKAHHFDPVTIGEQVTTWPDVQDLDGNRITWERFQAKPTVLMFAPSEEAIPALANVQKKYGDKINIVIIFRYLTQKSVQEVLDYYALFNLPIEPVARELALDLEAIKGYFQPFQLNKSELICIPDTDGELFNRFNIFNSNTVLVLDANQYLVEGLAVGRAYFDDKDDAKNALLLDRELMRILQQILK